MFKAVTPIVFLVDDKKHAITLNSFELVYKSSPMELPEITGEISFMAADHQQKILIAKPMLVIHLGISVLTAVIKEYTILHNSLMNSGMTSAATSLECRVEYEVIDEEERDPFIAAVEEAVS